MKLEQKLRFLCQAANGGNRDAFNGKAKALLDANPDIDLTSARGKGCFAQAIVNTNTDLLRILLEHYEEHKLQDDTGSEEFKCAFEALSVILKEYTPRDTSGLSEVMVGLLKNYSDYDTYLQYISDDDSDIGGEIHYSGVSAAYVVDFSVPDASDNTFIDWHRVQSLGDSHNSCEVH